MPLSASFRRICSLRQVLGLVWVAGLLLGCGGEPAPKPTAAPAAQLPPKVVEMAAAKRQAWPRTVSVQGALLADDDAVIGSKLAGRVEKIAVDLGSVVKRGDLLVTLDRSELDLQVELAEAQLRQACAAIGLDPADQETELDVRNAPPVQLEQALLDEADAAVRRAQALIPSRAITSAEYDAFVAQQRAATARLNSALNAVETQIALIGVRRKELALARQQVVDSQLVAPFDGVIEARRVSPGEYVSVGQPLLTLVRSERLRFTAGVPESKALAVKPGQKVEIRVAGSDEPIVSTVARVSPIVTQTSRSLRIEADVPNPELTLQAGLFAEADIVVDPYSQALAVPQTAITRFAGVEKVWLVVDGQASQHSVRTGRQARGFVEILEGVAEGAQLVADAEEGRNGPVAAPTADGQLSAVGQPDAPPPSDNASPPPSASLPAGSPPAG